MALARSKQDLKQHQAEGHGYCYKSEHAGMRNSAANPRNSY